MAITSSFPIIRWFDAMQFSSVQFVAWNNGRALTTMFVCSCSGEAPPWAAAPCLLSADWDSTRLKASSSPSCTSSKRCQRVGNQTEPSPNTRLFFLMVKRDITEWMFLCLSADTLTAYWSKISPQDVMNFLSLLEWVVWKLNRFFSENGLNVELHDTRKTCDVW